MLTLCAAIAILVLGVVFKPQKKAERALSESDLSRLQPAPAVRFDELSRELADASGYAAPRLVYLPGIPHTAVVWDSTRAITALEGSAAKPDWKPAATPNGAPFAVWSFPAMAGKAIAEPSTTITIAAGDWVMAVARASADQIVFAEGTYQGISEARCGGFEYREANSSARISANFLGGGLFSSDGKLLGAIVACNGEPVVVSAGSVSAVLRQPVFITDRLEKDYGLRVNEAAGAMVAAVVWSGSAADVAGVKPGDAIVQAQGKAVTEWSDLEALEEGDASTILVRRGRRTVKMQLVRARADITADGLTLVSRTSNVVVSVVAPDSAAARANLQPGDRLIRVGGAAIETPDAAARALTRYAKGPVNLEIERGGARAEVMLLP